MGWASGSELFESVLKITLPTMGRATRKRVINKLIDAFEEHDCDTLSECCGQWEEFDEVWAERGEE